MWATGKCQPDKTTQPGAVLGSGHGVQTGNFPNRRATAPVRRSCLLLAKAPVNERSHQNKACKTGHATESTVPHALRQTKPSQAKPSCRLGPAFARTDLAGRYRAVR